QNENPQSFGQRGRRRALGALLRDLRAGLQVEFDRALYSRPITLMQFIGFGGIKLAQNSMKPFGAVAGPDSGESSADVFIGRRARKEWLPQSAEIEASAADQNGNVAP